MGTGVAVRWGMAFGVSFVEGLCLVVWKIACFSVVFL